MAKPQAKMNKRLKARRERFEKLSIQKRKGRKQPGSENRRKGS